ncbi:hypothetical protein LKO27_04115 [Tessaracoccus sp. OS52]|nr:hypothetical protein [Tessaracoccus sp. OS52]MCC2592603.1 hypothetical protein [Tessaracoccus sp. OS52]
MVLATLLETTSSGSLPTILAGVIAFALLMAALLWVTGMGSGRPNSR